MSPRALFAAAAVALVIVPAAGAKGLVLDRVCGASDCVAIERHPNWTVSLYVGDVRPAPPVLPYYRLHYRVPAASPQTSSRHATPSGHHPTLPDSSRGSASRGRLSQRSGRHSGA